MRLVNSYTHRQTFHPRVGIPKPDKLLNYYVQALHSGCCSTCRKDKQLLGIWFMTKKLLCFVPMHVIRTTAEVRRKRSYCYSLQQLTLLFMRVSMAISISHTRNGEDLFSFQWPPDPQWQKQTSKLLMTKYLLSINHSQSHHNPSLLIWDPPFYCLI